MMQAAASPHDADSYDTLRASSETFYHTLKPVRSPALGVPVTFPSEAFNHILFKRARQGRDRADQLMRFKLLPRAYRLLAHANTYQEFEETSRTVEVKVRKHRETREKRVQYWGIIAIFEHRKIKVILRKLGDGQVHFWSVVPAWTTNKVRDVRFASTMKGNPEED